MLESCLILALFFMGVLSPLAVPIFITVQPKIAVGFRGASQLITRNRRRRTVRTPATGQHATARAVRFSTPTDRFGATAPPKG